MLCVAGQGDGADSGTRAGARTPVPNIDADTGIRRSASSPSASAPRHLMTLRTADTVWTIRASSREELNDWKFAFQSSIAVIIDKILKVRRACDARPALSSACTRSR